MIHFVTHTWIKWRIRGQSEHDVCSVSGLLFCAPQDEEKSVRQRRKIIIDGCSEVSDCWQRAREEEEHLNKPEQGPNYGSITCCWTPHSLLWPLELWNAVFLSPWKNQISTFPLNCCTFSEHGGFIGSHSDRNATKTQHVVLRGPPHQIRDQTDP